MSSTRSDKWLLLQWSSGSRSVVEWKSVISPTYDANVVGTVVIADKGNGTHEAATVICSARDRVVLERQISPKASVEDDDAAGPSRRDEQEDFSASASSWAPSDDNVSSDDEEVLNKKIKLEHTFNNKRNRKILKPCHRADAINNILAKCRKRTQRNIKNNRRTNGVDQKSIPDSTKKNNRWATRTSDIVSINVRDIMDMKQSFQELFNLLRELKLQFTPQSQIQSQINSLFPTIETEPEMKHEVNEMNADNECGESDRSRSEELNRSDDNVLITNKYDNADKKRRKTNKPSKIEQNQILVQEDNNPMKDQSEWVPIGSGKTLIHKSQFKKVNWKSYTVATRTLLLAVFPRRVLATHSLTGKRSPAFQDKPPKMCLDPKIVSDVIIEITDRFNVKENLVRTIITTKCADECKMFKTRLQRKTLPAKEQENNVMVVTNDEINQTC